jgi:hypothetical protein
VRCPRGGGYYATTRNSCQALTPYILCPPFRSNAIGWGLRPKIDHGPREGAALREFRWRYRRPAGRGSVSAHQDGGKGRGLVSQIGGKREVLLFEGFLCLSDETLGRFVLDLPVCAQGAEVHPVEIL